MGSETKPEARPTQKLKAKSKTAVRKSRCPICGLKATLTCRCNRRAF